MEWHLAGLFLACRSAFAHSRSRTADRISHCCTDLHYGARGGLPDSIIAVAKDLAAIWFIWLTSSWIAELATKSPRIRSGELTAQMIRPGACSFGVVAIFVLIMLIAHRLITNDPARVRASGFGEVYIDVEVFAYVATTDWKKFLAVTEDAVLRIMEIVKAAGSAFAVPSRTLYHGRDKGLDPERREEAGKQVRERASAHELPFPGLPDSDRETIVDTLDYPPTGSPKADQG